MPFSRQGYSGAYFANNGSWAWPCLLNRMMLYPFCSRKSLLVEENPATSSNNAWTFASFSTNVLTRLHAVAQHVASSGTTAAYVSDTVASFPRSSTSNGIFGFIRFR